MLPYKIRKPVYGGAKTKTSQSSSTSSSSSLPPLYGNEDDDDDPLIYGGALQRAILSDLSELKTRYLRDLDQSRNNSSVNTRNQRHAAESVGCTFRIFKTTFRRARFGCIHNRAVPSRIDKGEFAQLIYSSCWYLLHQAVSVNSTHNNSLSLDCLLDGVNKDDDDDDDTTSCNDDTQREVDITNFLQNVTFAIFALYTLHQTNTLPNTPYDVKVTYNHPGMIQQQQHESELQRKWSYLPLGKAGVGGKIYRRHYKLPVRVDRCSYMSLMLVRDICATIVAKANYRNNCNSLSSSLCNDSSSNCNNYNLAVDGIHVIDRMMHDDAFFTYCEYHGPVGLEGLAGNPNFYNAYYGRLNDGEMKKKTMIRKSRANNKQRHRQDEDDVQAVSTAEQESQTTSLRVLNSDELQSIRNTCDMADSLHYVSSLSSRLDRYKTNLYTIHTELCTNRRNEHNISNHHQRQLQQNHGNNNNLKPRQRELVETTIREIWIDGVEQSGNVSKPSYLDMINKPSTMETNEFQGVEEQSELHSPAALHPQNQLSELEFQHPITLPPTFSNTLCSNIRETLLDFNDIVDSVRQSILKDRNNITSMKTSQSMNATKTETDGKSIDHLSTSDAATTTSSTKRDYDQTSTILYDGVSVSTGAGKKALSELLSTSKHNIENEQPLDDFWNLQDDQISYEAESVAADVTKTMSDEVDELSVSVGPGKHALSALLSFSVYDDRSMPQQHKKQNKKQKTTTNSKQKPPTNISSNIYSDDSSFSNSVTDAGRHALQSLLGLASESAKLPKQSSTGKKVKKTSNKSSSAPTKKSTSSKKKQVSTTKQKTVTTKKVGEDSSISDASTGAGRQALNSLLGMAMEETCNSSDDKECHI
eukprot:scaffold18839_cov61-Cyclotella_meneghiniana.AAC.8